MWVAADTRLDMDGMGLMVVGVASDFDQHDSGVHCHVLGQLLFVHSGCARITLDDRLCMLAPTRLIWIPPGLLHRVETTAAAGFRSVYLDVQRVTGLPPGLQVMTVSPLLREGLERMAFAPLETDWQAGPGARLLAVCLDEITGARREGTILQLPADRRLQGLQQTALPPLLKQLATEVGASEKTVSRIFQAQTGMSYQQWRQQWRLLKAIELLAGQNSLTQIADALGFASDSAFVTFFRKQTGYAPRAYMAA